MGTVLSLLLKLLLLFYQNKIFQRKQSLQFWISEMQRTNGKHEWTVGIKVAKGLLRLFKLCKNQIFETNRFTRSILNKLVHLLVRKLAYAAWNLIRLNSKFHAMQSSTWCEIYNSVWRQWHSSPSLFSLIFFFTHTGRSNHGLTQWKQYYQCRWNCYCCFIKTYSKYTSSAQSNNNLVNLLFRKLACGGS